MEKRETGAGLRRAPVGVVVYAHAGSDDARAAAVAAECLRAPLDLNDEDGLVSVRAVVNAVADGVWALLPRRASKGDERRGGTERSGLQLC